MAYGATLTLPTITGSHTDFPVLLKEADFPTGAKDGGANSIANGGGDLVAYTSSAKTTQLPIEVVTFVAGGTPDIEVYVKIPTAATSNTIFIEADAVQTSQPAVTATYGRNAVWADYESVVHFTESGSGTSGEFADSSGNNVTGVVDAGVATQLSTDMPWAGNWQSIDGSTDYIKLENSENLLDSSDLTVQMIWRHTHSLSGYNIGVIGNYHNTQSNNYIQLTLKSTGASMRAHDGSGSANVNTGVYSGSVVNYSHFTMSGSAAQDYRNGSLRGENATIVGDGHFVTAKPIRIGSWYDLTNSRDIRMKFGRVRLRKSVLSADWIATEHANMDAGSNWVTVGTWADGGAASDIVLFRRRIEGMNNVFR